MALVATTVSGPCSYLLLYCVMLLFTLVHSIQTHYGALGGGHYVAFAKNPNGKWYHYNDSACRVSWSVWM